MTERRPATRLLSATQVAGFCEVDLKTIHNWANKGKIPSCRTPGRHLRFRPLDVVDFLRAYGFSLPPALRHARPRVAIVDADPGGLASARRALSRRFEVFTFDHAVDGLLGLAAADPDVLVLVEHAPIDPALLVVRIGASSSMRHVRIVTVGFEAPGAAAWVTARDVGKLRETLERVTGVD